MYVQQIVNGHPVPVFVGGVTARVNPEDTVIDHPPTSPLDYEIITIRGDTSAFALPDGQYFWDPAVNNWTPTPGGGSVTGLTNPLTSDLDGANRNLTNLAGAASNTVTLRDQGAGDVALTASPTTAGRILINGVPLSSDSTARDWAAGTPYVADQLAVESGILYRRNAAGTSAGTFAADAANWTAISAAAVTTANDFAPATAYQTNELITEGGRLYRRISAGTSGATFVADAANWQQLAEPVTVAPDWAASTGYIANQLVIEGGALYRRIADGTSTATFALDAANWQPITASAIHTVTDWQASTNYAANEVVLQGGIFYRRNAAGTSGATFDAAEAANWAQVGDGVHTAEDWQPSTAYEVNQVVVNNARLYRRNAAGTSGLAFDATEEASWTALSREQTSAPDWQPATGYIQDELAVVSGVLYRSRSARTSTGTFDAAETVNWERLTYEPRIIELTGGTTPLTEADHAHALIILRSGSNILTWANAAETFPFDVWNLQGTTADVLGSTLSNGARTTGVVSGVDSQIAIPQFDIRPPVDKTTLLTAANAINTGKTPHLTQVFVSDLAGAGSAGIAVCMGAGTDPLIAAGEWHHGYTGIPVTA